MEIAEIQRHLSKLSIYELRNMARILGIEKPSFLERGCLIDKIMEYQNDYSVSKLEMVLNEKTLTNN